jgi:putative ABC transport system permease protein
MEVLGLTDPIGHSVKNYFVGDKFDFEIIGVVENVQYRALREKCLPVIYYLRKDGLYRVVVRLQSGNLMESITKLERSWKEIEPDFPLKYEFADQMIQANYQKEIRTRSLLSVMAFLAIAISMLGIFGLSVFTTQKRTKEIGIRKVNGARVWEVMAMLNKEFVVWVVIAFLIAAPIAWFVMHKWLETFADKTPLSWWIFALAGLLSLIIALLTVSWQSWRAATRNPVESLRNE